MHLTASNWKNVASQTIKNCLGKCSFSQDQTVSPMNKSNFERYGNILMMKTGIKCLQTKVLI